MATLVITVNGPFAFVDDNPASGYITLMAPMCAQHVAGIASIEKDNQIILTNVNCRNHDARLGGCHPHRYELRPVLGQLNSTPWNSQQVLRVSPAKPFDPREWRFWLTLPRPYSFVEVNPVQAYIIQPGINSSVLQSYAIGVRLVYNDWDGCNIPLFHESVPVPDQNGNPFALRFTKSQNDFAFVEIEYASPLRDDPDHEDAVDCFENLMSALGLPWSIFIPQNVPLLAQFPPPLYPYLPRPLHLQPSPPPNSITASKLNDCLAAVAWIG
jgi:hypothetical protein